MFPYYIVRFKRENSICTDLITRRFHTTQYDLNATTYTFPAGTGTGFPYYIVRFKLAASYPYQQPNEHSFHTTQYDLNLFFFLYQLLYIFQFPYYIVRFKQNHAIQKLQEQSFHTTQYDLNSSERNFCVHALMVVSILHSTI